MEKTYFAHYLQSISDKSERQAAIYNSAINMCSWYIPLHFSAMASLISKTIININDFLIILIAIVLVYSFYNLIQFKVKMINSLASITNAAFKVVDEFCKNSEIHSFYGREYEIYIDNKNVQTLYSNRGDALKLIMKTVIWGTVIMMTPCLWSIMQNLNFNWFL